MSSYTPTSGAYFNDDGSMGIGVECFFDQSSPKVSQTWTLAKPVSAVEEWGNVSMRTSGAEADVLVGVFLGDREIWGAILKAGGSEPTVNIPEHQDPEAITPSNILRIDMEAAGSGDAWAPLNCEIRVLGRWQ